MCIIFFVGMKQAVKDDCQIMIAEVWDFLQHLFILFVIDQTHGHKLFRFCKVGKEAYVDIFLRKMFLIGDKNIGIDIFHRNALQVTVIIWI